MNEEVIRRILGASQVDLVRESLTAVAHLRSALDRDESVAARQHLARLAAIEQAVHAAEARGTAGKLSAHAAHQSASRAAASFQAAFGALAGSHVDHEAVRRALAESLTAWHRAITAAGEAIAQLDASRQEILAANASLGEVTRAIRQSH